MTLVTCKVCGKNFYVKPNHLKIGWGKYCSIKCRSQSQFTGEKVNCFTCGKEIYRILSKLKKSKSGKYFCTKSCQTLWRNSYFTGERHANWKHGEASYRNLLLKSKHPRECAICKINDLR